MKMAEALEPIARLTTPHVVLTTMSAVTDWPSDAEGPHVFHYVPSSMGQGPSLGLGLALASPDSRVIVLNGDGCMLMNLGSLATIGAQGARNYTLIVLDNGIYEVTGGQPRVGTTTVDFPAIARGCGITSVFDFDDPKDWTAHAEQACTSEGPVFVRLAVDPRFGRSSPKARRPMVAQLADLRSVLNVEMRS